MILKIFEIHILRSFFQSHSPWVPEISTKILNPVISTPKKYLKKILGKKAWNEDYKQVTHSNSVLSSKAFVQFQKVHRIIHPVFRKVHHSFSNIFPELNHLLRQSDFGLENGSHNKKTAERKKWHPHWKTSALLPPASVSHCTLLEYLEPWCLCVRQHKKVYKKYKITRYLSKIISLLIGLQVNQSFFTSYNLISGVFSLFGHHWVMWFTFSLSVFLFGHKKTSFSGFYLWRHRARPSSICKLEMLQSDWLRAFSRQISCNLIG